MTDDKLLTLHVLQQKYLLAGFLGVQLRCKGLLIADARMKRCNRRL